MKILWFSHRDIKHPKAGGAERTIFEVGKRLAARGHQFNNISVQWKGSPIEDEIEGVHIIRLKNNVIAHFQTPILLRQFDYDVVIDDLGHAVPWFSEYFSKKNGVVFFRHLHARSLKGQVSLPLRIIITDLEKMYPLIYRKWIFITESNSSIEDLSNLGINKERIFKIPPGVDTNFFRPGKKTDFPSIIYFGGMRDYKRPWDSIYAFKEVLKKYREARLYIVGTGPSLGRVRNLAKSMNLLENISFMGRLSNEDLASLISSSWINIHCSVTEGFGLSIIESSASGTPTVAYSVPGVSETIEDGKNGILVRDGDPKELSFGLMKIIESYPGKWIESSREVALKYSWENTVQRWERLLLNISGSNE